MTQQPNDNKRILGHLRIFQSVFNDLKMRHEIVTLEDGTKRYAYVYDSLDPYALEDNHFPGTVASIQDEILKAQIEAKIEVADKYLGYRAASDTEAEAIAWLDSQRDELRLELSNQLKTKEKVS